MHDLTPGLSLFDYENEVICGVDEAGRGPLAGPVMAAAVILDPNRPIWDKARYYVDAFVTYRTKLFARKIGTSVQLNVRNLGEDGRLQPVGAYPNGVPLAYRIIDPALYILQVKFDL